MSTVTGHLGKLIGNTRSPANLPVALRGSVSARRGELVRVPHIEREGQPATDCLGRIVGISRSNVLYSDALGERPQLLLVGWALAGTDLGDLGSVRAVMVSGFRAADGTPVRGLGRSSVFLLATAVFGDVGGDRKLLRVHI